MDCILFFLLTNNDEKDVVVYFVIELLICADNYMTSHVYVYSAHQISLVSMH